jgi:serine protease AprX
VRSHHGKVTDRLASINGFAVQLPARDAKKLRGHKSVHNVTLNRRVKTTALDPSLLATNFPKTVGADKAWAAGYTGKGVGVAVIDSGINGDHPDFKNPDGTSRVTNVIANPAATRAGDDVGHGTHVAGIVAGNSAARPAGDAKAGAYEGIAPEADIIAVKTADDQGNSTTLDVINALEFVVSHKDELNIDVVNLSVSSDTPGSYLVDPLDAAVEFAWHAGIVVVSAAGNRGNAADASHYAPGNDPFVISVGATDEAGTANPADDTVATFSSRGRGLDGFNKPEVYAPGARIVAPLAAGSAFHQLCPTCVVADSYLRIGGTSMAAPVVAGAAALLLQARPELNPDQVKELLTANVNATADGAAQVDVSKALTAPAGRGANQGTVPSPPVKAVLLAVGLDPTRATWTKATWTKATWTQATWTKATWTKATWTGGSDPKNAQWAKATWTCTTCTGALAAVIELTKSSWSKSSWSKSSWSKSSWSKSSWSKSTWSGVLGW